MSSQWDHERREGYLDAYRELQRRVAADLSAKRGDIKPAKVLYAYYDSTIVLMKGRLLRWIRSA